MIISRAILIFIIALIPILVEAKLNNDQQTYLDALEALNRGKVDRFNSLSNSLSDYILSPYLEYERIRHDNYKNTQDIKDFIARYPNQSISDRLKLEWLLSLPGKGKWKELLANYDDQLRSSTLNCYFLRALYRTGETDKALAATEKAWVVSGSSPKAFDPLFRVWLKSEYFKPEFAYERVQLALARGRTSLASYSSNFLKGDQKKAAAMMVWVHKNPAILANNKYFPSANPYMKDAVIHGLKRRVRWRPDAALIYWKKHRSRFEFTDAESAELERKIYLGLARQYNESASDLLASLPSDYNSREVFEWQIRVSLRARDWTAVSKWIEAFEKTEGMKPKWYYWKYKAYVAQSIEIPPFDKLQLENLAQTRSYYGFLAAELLGQPLTLTNMPLPVTSEEFSAIGQLPEIDRLKEFVSMGHTKTAQREWGYLKHKKVDPAGLMSLAKLAYGWGWHNKAITAVIAADHWSDLLVRFPMPHKSSFLIAAGRVNLDVSWLFAIARQESAFAVNARSGRYPRGCPSRSRCRGGP